MASRQEFMDSYEDSYWKHQSVSGRDVPGLLEIIALNSNPVGFKDAFLQVVHLFFKGLLKYGAVGNQLYVLDEMFNAGRNLMGSFYSVDASRLEGALNDARAVCIQNRDAVVSGSYGNTNFMNLSGMAGNLYCFELGQAIENPSPGGSIDTIVAVANGGLEPALIAADRLNPPGFVMVRYSRLKEEDSAVLSLVDISKQIEGKRVLIVDDVVGRGLTMAMVGHYVGERRPAELYGAAAQGSEHRLNEMGVTLLKRDRAASMVFVYPIKALV